MERDRSWMYNRNNPGRAGMVPKFVEGVTHFINHAKTLDSFLTSRLIRCPCVKCENVRYQTTENVSMHLMKSGFKPGYTVWTSHGEVESNNRFNNFVVGESSGSTGRPVSQEELFKITRTKKTTDPTEGEKWIEQRAQETYERFTQKLQEYRITPVESQDAPLSQEITEQLWRERAGEPVRGVVYGYTEKAYHEKNGGFYCASSSSVDGVDKARLSKMEDKISLLTAELAAVVEREKKRDEQIAVDSQRYMELRVQLNSLLDSGKIIPPGRALGMRVKRKVKRRVMKHSSI